MGVFDHLKLSFFHLLSLQLSFLQLSTLFLSTFWSRAGPPQGPKSPKMVWLSNSLWNDFSDSWASRKASKIHVFFFCIAPKGPKIYNQWPKVGSRAIFGVMFIRRTPPGCKRVRWFRIIQHQSSISPLSPRTAPKMDRESAIVDWKVLFGWFF